MSRIQSRTAQPKLILHSAFESLRLKRLVRKELLRSASISVGSMLIAATFGLLSVLPAIMFVAGSLIGHGLALLCVTHDYSNNLGNSYLADRDESNAAA